ncbi:MAG: hypothetical protein KF739_02940 [Cryobacterium sp.]|nr:hypothetical protein [Cryobacterium sp.]
MTGSTLLTRLRSSRWRRLAIALLGVPAILIGLLAMHVLTNDGMSESGAPHAISTLMTDAAPAAHGHDAGMAPMTSPDTPAPTGDCEGPCGPSHDILGMICILALLVTIVLLTLHLILIRWEQLRRVVAALAAKAATLAPAAPPSLHVLSISRT